MLGSCGLLSCFAYASLRSLSDRLLSRSRVVIRLVTSLATAGAEWTYYPCVTDRLACASLHSRPAKPGIYRPSVPFLENTSRSRRKYRTRGCQFYEDSLRLRPVSLALVWVLVPFFRWLNGYTFRPHPIDLAYERVGELLVSIVLRTRDGK